MRGYFVTLGCFAAALVSHALGSGVGAVVFTGLAIGLESIFWVRVLANRRPATAGLRPATGGL